LGIIPLPKKGLPRGTKKEGGKLPRTPRFGPTPFKVANALSGRKGLFPWPTFQPPTKAFNAQNLNLPGRKKELWNNSPLGC